MTITIRPIAAEDRDTWSRLFVDYGIFYETDFTTTVIDGVWEWLMTAGHPVTALVAVSGSEVSGSGASGSGASDSGVSAGTVVGFALFREQPDTFRAGPGWYLDDLYVEPAARGLGAGTALIAAIKEHALAHGGGTIRWITAADNFTAQSVYDRVASKKTWVTYELET